ncbi:MAG TPA: hypothetical protein VJT33_10765 [bacterium]|nr:hypothetical protein [bacterium]
MKLCTAALAVAVAVAGGAPAVSAQSMCRQIQITTTRTATPIAVTPLDTIAFPAPLTPASLTLIRQIVVCPSAGGNLPSTVVAPSVIGTPVFVSPVIGTPVFGTTVVDSPIVVPVGTYGQPGPPAAGQPSAPQRPAIAGSAAPESVRDLATQPAKFDRSVVSVTGTAAAVQQAADASGAPVITFRLEAGGASVGVVAWGRAAVKAGETVRVSGPFYVSTPFSGPAGSPWHDVIAADVVER